MSDQPNPATGEWTVETIAILQAHGGIDAIVAAHNAALDKFSRDSDTMISILREQLAAERERTAKAQAEYQTAWKEMQMQRESREDYQGEAYELNLQLAAEREASARYRELWHSGAKVNQNWIRAEDNPGFHRHE